MGKTRTILVVAGLAILVAGLSWMGWFVQRRLARCAAVPLLGEEMLTNAALAPGDDPRMPRGWSRAANGVELRGPAIGDGRGFDYDQDGRALQLLGIGNYVETPPIAVQPGRSYCFAGRALTDSDKHSATRLRIAFEWRDASNRLLREDLSGWQSVVLWQQSAPPADWSSIQAAFAAPRDATTLLVRLRPASDDRVYLDAMHVRQGGQAPDTPQAQAAEAVRIQPWPNGYRAALSFSFDWETAMGGLIHSRSVDDPNASQDPIARGLRMRQGITTTLDLFRPYGIRATYYATGYNFLLGNTEHQHFMGDPTFSWADHTISRKWPNDAWTTRPWFADDPYGTFQSNPAWYFGDLIARLQQEHQSIETHTFSHMDGGLATTQQWRDDLATWRAAAEARGVPMARSLAFPWSSSAGLSDTDWSAIEAAGITSVTRTKPGQPQYQLASPEDAHCRPVPGHETILACPDFYLHDQQSAEQALRLIDHSIAVSGTLDLWAHTEEVVSPEQIAAWGQVVAYAAQQRAVGQLWIAPLSEIADWQAALTKLKVMSFEFKVTNPQSPMRFLIKNESVHDLKELTLQVPIDIDQYMVNGQQFKTLNSKLITLNVPAGQSVEVQAWPA